MIPGKEKRLVETVKYVDDEIIIGNRVDVWAWKLTIDEYTLKHDLNQIKSDTSGRGVRKSRTRNFGKPVGEHQVAICLRK